MAVLAFPKPISRRAAKARAKRQYQKSRDACLLAVYQRAQGRCEKCGCPVLHKHDPRATEWTVMHGHEQIPRSLGGDATSDKNVICLCMKCHALIHGRG